MTGAVLSRILADAGYKGHNAPEEHKFKVYTQGQKRGMTDAIRRQLKRRAAIEPVIGHCKEDHRMDRNFLAHREGDAINAVLAAAGYNFRRLLAWLGNLLRRCCKPSATNAYCKKSESQKFTADIVADFYSSPVARKTNTFLFLLRVYEKTLGGAQWQTTEGTTLTTPDGEYCGVAR